MGKSIRVVVKRVEYVELDIDEENGFDVPEDLTEFVKFTNNIHSDIKETIESVSPLDWSSSEYEIIDFQCKENEE